MLSRLPICPREQVQECLSSWIERTACFYGCDMERWLRQFATELISDNSREALVDLDTSDKAEVVWTKWSGLPVVHSIRTSTDRARVLPVAARLAFCDRCWDADVQSGRQPYIRSYWLNWTTVHCEIHQSLLSAKNRSVDMHAPYVSWQDVWASKANWRRSLDLREHGGFAGSLWYRAPKHLPQVTERLARSLEQFADPTDQLADATLGLILNRWVTRDSQYAGPKQFPILLENRIEILCQAAEQLELSQ
jgi:hypothetical protein